MRSTPLLLLISISLLFPREAHAYLDPGSGSYIIQILIGALLGGVFTIKIYWRKFKAYFSKDKKGEEAEK